MIWDIPYSTPLLGQNCWAQQNVLPTDENSFDEQGLPFATHGAWDFQVEFMFCFYSECTASLKAIQKDIHINLACGKSFQCGFSTGIRLMGNIHIHSMIYF